MLHYSDVILGAMASQLTGITIDQSTGYSGTDQRKHQSSASLAFVRGIHRWPVNSLHKGPVTRKKFPFDDVIMLKRIASNCYAASNRTFESNYWSGNCEYELPRDVRIDTIVVYLWCCYFLLWCAVIQYMLWIIRKWIHFLHFPWRRNLIRYFQLCEI